MPKVNTLRELVAAVEADDPAFMDAKLEFHVVQHPHRVYATAPEVEGGKIGWGFPRSSTPGMKYLGIELTLERSYKIIRQKKVGA